MDYRYLFPKLYGENVQQEQNIGLEALGDPTGNEDTDSTPMDEAKKDEPQEEETPEETPEEEPVEEETPEETPSPEEDEEPTEDEPELDTGGLDESSPDENIEGEGESEDGAEPTADEEPELEEETPDASTVKDDPLHKHNRKILISSLLLRLVESIDEATSAISSGPFFPLKTVILKELDRISDSTIKTNDTLLMEEDDDVAITKYAILALGFKKVINKVKIRRKNND